MRDVVLGKLTIDALDLLLDPYPVLPVEERVENVRHIGLDTDDEKDRETEQENIEPDGFILVKGKKKHTSAYVEKTSPISNRILAKSKRIVFLPPGLSLRVLIHAPRDTY
jgi:hypothetical protein